MEGLKKIEDMFKDRDWFHSVGEDNIGRAVVYVNFNCKETIFDIPDAVDGKQVLVHSAGSKTATREQYANCKEDNLPIALVEEIVDVTNFVERDVDDLFKELDRLETLCNKNTLESIFYEIHDQSNAVTNLSVRYPEVRVAMNKLYDTYGFDVIHDLI